MMTGYLRRAPEWKWQGWKSTPFQSRFPWRHDPSFTLELMHELGLLEEFLKLAATRNCTSCVRS